MEVWPQGLTGGVHGGSITQCPSHYQTPRVGFERKQYGVFLDKMDSGHMQRPLGMRDQNELADLNEIPRPTGNCELPTKYLSEIRQRCQTFCSLFCICETPRTCVSQRELSQIIQEFSRDFQVQ